MEEIKIIECEWCGGDGYVVCMRCGGIGCWHCLRAGIVKCEYCGGKGISEDSTISVNTERKSESKYEIKL